MAQSTYENIIKEIEGKQFAPIYVLQGEEAYFIDKIVAALEQTVLSEEEKSFNQTVVYGKDATAMAISMAAKRYPMPPAEYQLIIVKEAQGMKDIENLDNYFENPTKSTILCLALKNKKLDGRKKLAKLAKKYKVFNSTPIRDYEVAQWIESYLESKGKKIDGRANLMIAEYLGNNLSKITNEIDKMLINVKDAPIINLKHIEENIGISKDYNVFELQKAVGMKDFNKAIQIAHYFASDKKNHSIILSIATLNAYFSKVLIYKQNENKPSHEISKMLGLRSDYFLNEYRQAARNYAISKLEEIFGLLTYYDLRSKGVDGSNDDEGGLLIELLVKIMK
jgi:DNA polymerase-3 subunit delta